ncbi:ral guanine nucleotide dissociation stimulator-like [Heterocephalus glaber]|uniref:Ral guanine nucleotide dissociation stimulator-like n=1 Tax=Heterocephalus glaber TaxID=10181 RepID=A0AAX6S3L7_HETGA|nr:ral guanine nucleotide dissociation stimulator-like [Heterocephalus glaber]
MFSSCFLTSQGSGFRRSPRGGLGRIERPPVSRHPKRLWPFSQSSKGENASRQNYEVRGCLEILLEDARKSMVKDLVPSVLRGDTWFLHRFFQSYRSVGTTQQVLELLLKRCDTLMNSCRLGHILAGLGKGGGRQRQVRDAISTVLGTWLDAYHQDFQEPPDFPCLKQLVEYVQLRFPDSDLEHSAHLLLAQLQDPVPKEAKSEGLEVLAGGEWLRPGCDVGTFSCAALSSLLEEDSAGSETLELESDPVPSATAEPPRPPPVGAARRVGPLYNQQVGDSCIIRVSLEEGNGNMYKSVLVTCNDRTPTIIQKAMEKHFIEDNPKYYELVQIVSDRKWMKIPEDSNVFYAMKSTSPYNFILRQQTLLSWLDVSPGPLSTFHRWKQRRLKAL